MERVRNSYAYGCIHSGRIKKNDIEGIKNSKKYIELKNALHDNFIPEDKIYIDVIHPSNPERRELNKLYDLMNNGDVIIILGIATLGRTREEIKKNYVEIHFNEKRHKNFYLLIINDDYENALDPLSTVNNYGMQDVISDIQIKKNIELIDKIPDKIFQYNRGKKAKEITNGFIQSYWLYEEYFIDEKTAYKNIYSEMSKRSFQELSKEYEASSMYELDEANEQEKYNIIVLPKRIGIVPDGFKELIDLHENKRIDLKVACEKIGIKKMSIITYERYKIKYFYGKKAIFQCFKRYDEKIIKKIALKI